MEHQVRKQPQSANAHWHARTPTPTSTPTSTPTPTPTPSPAVPSAAVHIMSAPATPAPTKPQPKIPGKKGDAKPSVFTLFGVDSAGVATNASNTTTSAPVPPASTKAAPNRSQITNLHEQVRIKPVVMHAQAATPAPAAATVLCRICQTVPITHAFQPCGHRAACLECAIEWFASVRTCPLCSQSSTGVVAAAAGPAAAAAPLTEMALLSPGAQMPQQLTPAPAGMCVLGDYLFLTKCVHVILYVMCAQQLTPAGSPPGVCA